MTTQKLLVVESPAKAKTITKYLGNTYKVLASCGHVRAIPSRSNAVDIAHAFEAAYEINEGSKKYLNTIVEASKHCTDVYMATDPDREGEAIAWHVSQVMKDSEIKIDGRVHRIMFNEITPNAIKTALKNPRDINMDLVYAQQARQTLDYLVGFNLSPVLWRKLPGSRSAGRVQSVALRILCEREHEIMRFKPMDYWTVHGCFTLDSTESTTKASLAEMNGHKIEKFSFTTATSAERIINILNCLEYVVKDVEKKDICKNPEAPFITSTLIQTASQSLKMSAKKVMQVAQKLYEGIDVDGKLVGLITYMRTDSINVSPDAIGKARDVIKTEYGEKYLPDKARIFKKKVKNAQEAHEAIRPTDPHLIPSKIKTFLSDDEWKLYDLIWNRFIACQMSSAIIARTVVRIVGRSNNVPSLHLQAVLEDDIISHLFKASSHQIEAVFKVIGTTVVFDGFYRLMGNQIAKQYKNKKNNEDSTVSVDTTDEQQYLPPMFDGQTLEIAEILSNQHTTTAPARYSEATLVKKMEDLGIGRPSTYATIMSILQDRKYVVLDKNKFHVEDRGEIVNTFLNLFFTKYVEYDFTASLEEELDAISNGDKQRTQVLQDFWQAFKQNVDFVSQLPTKDILQQIENMLSEFLFANGLNDENTSDISQLNKHCPKCQNGDLKLKNSKYSPFVGCSNYPNCDYAIKFSLHKHNGKNSVSSTVSSITEGCNVEMQNSMVHSGNVRIIAQQENAQIMLNKGQYGYYLSLCESGKIVKNFTLPQSCNVDNFTLSYEQARKLFDMPFKIGKHPDSDDDIMIGIGKYGPYILYKKKFHPIKNKTLADMVSFSLHDVMAVLAASKKK